MYEFIIYEMCQRAGADSLPIFDMAISTRLKHSFFDNVLTKFMISNSMKGSMKN